MILCKKYGIGGSICCKVYILLHSRAKNVAKRAKQAIDEWCVQQKDSEIWP